MLGFDGVGHGVHLSHVREIGDESVGIFDSHFLGNGRKLGGVAAVHQNLVTFGHQLPGCVEADSIGATSKENGLHGLL